MVQARPHRVDGNLQVLGDLLARQPLQLEEREHVALLVTHAGQNATHPPLGVAAQLHAGGLLGLVRGFCAAEPARKRFADAAPSKAIVDAIAREPKQPGRNRARLNLVEGRKGLAKDFLRHVLDLLRRHAQPARVAHDQSRIALIEQAQPRRVAPAAAREQQLLVRGCSVGDKRCGGQRLGHAHCKARCHERVSGSKAPEQALSFKKSGTRADRAPRTSRCASSLRDYRYRY